MTTIRNLFRDTLLVVPTRYRAYNEPVSLALANAEGKWKLFGG